MLAHFGSKITPWPQEVVAKSNGVGGKDDDLCCTVIQRDSTSIEGIMHTFKKGVAWFITKIGNGQRRRDVNFGASRL
jgi:hypothetical protein